jgi:hypothetical protein
MDAICLLKKCRNQGIRLFIRSHTTRRERVSQNAALSAEASEKNEPAGGFTVVNGHHLDKSRPLDQ